MEFHQDPREEVSATHFDLQELSLLQPNPSIRHCHVKVDCFIFLLWAAALLLIFFFFLLFIRCQHKINFSEMVSTFHNNAGHQTHNPTNFRASYCALQILD